jgi:hypothetical protein
MLLSSLFINVIYDQKFIDRLDQGTKAQPQASDPAGAATAFMALFDLVLQKVHSCCSIYAKYAGLLVHVNGK